MIPGRFEYHRPDSLTAAVGMLTRWGDDARVIAGGHSLIPMMKLRLAMPEHLVDLAAIDGLRNIRVDGGVVSIGAMTTQAELIGSAELGRAAPLLQEAALQIADPQVRYQGTIGGNVANGDPGNDMPAVMQCLDASFTLVGPDGERQVRAREFYEAAFFTARDDLEILSEIHFPATTGGFAYEKQKRKIGDYATAAAAVLLTRSADGSCGHAAVALTNLADTPVFCSAASELLMRDGVNEASIAAALQACADVIKPVEDTRGPVPFKRHAARVTLKRALESAWSRA